MKRFILTNVPSSSITREALAHDSSMTWIHSVQRRTSSGRDFVQIVSDLERLFLLCNLKC